MEKKNTGLGGDRDPRLVGDLQAATTFEILLLKEYLNVSFELRPIFGRQTRHEGDIPLDDGAPFGEKRSASNCFAPPSPQPGEHGDSRFGGMKNPSTNLGKTSVS